MSKHSYDSPISSDTSDVDAIRCEKKHRRRVYLLPNLLTTGALFCGFYAIVAAGTVVPVDAAGAAGKTGHFVSAAIAIFIAMVLDGLDGRVARLTNTQSEFGKQYDSISDMVSFGIAPALVIYEWSLSGLVSYGPVMGKISWLVAFVYAVCAALRLARFNILPPSAAKDHFVGLASPAAAALLVGSIWFGQEVGVDRHSLWVMLTSLVITLGAALMMVSNFRYFSLKQFEKINHVSFLTIVALVFVFIAIWIAPAYVLFMLALLYVLSGLMCNRHCRKIFSHRLFGRSICAAEKKLDEDEDCDDSCDDDGGDEDGDEDGDEKDDNCDDDSDDDTQESLL